MTFTRDDLKRLRFSIVAVVFLFVIGVLVILKSEQFLDGEQKLRRNAQEQRVAAQDQLARVANEEREIRDNLVHYEKLVARGAVGQEKRLDWIDAITEIKARRRLFEIRYTIEPQRAIDYPGITNKDGAEVMVSRMKLDMLLLHEEDLLNFLSDLNAAGKAVVSVRSCSISRTERVSASSRAVAPRLSSTCIVDLISLRGREVG